MIKLVLFATAVAWTLVNVAGFFMALGDSAGAMHLAIHAVLAVGFGAAAYWLRPRRGRSERSEPEARVDLLENEVSDLQRQLNETQRGLDFTQQLLAQRRSAADPHPHTRPPDNAD